MNDDKIKSQTIKPVAGNAIPTSEEHPLHILDNQTDPAKKPRKFDVPQKPIRTFEKDLQEEMARVKASGANVNEPKKSFFSFLSKKSAFENVIAPVSTVHKSSIMEVEIEKPKAKSIPVKANPNVLEENIIVEVPKVVESPGFLVKQMKEQSTKSDGGIFNSRPVTPRPLPLKPVPPEPVEAKKMEEVKKVEEAKEVVKEAKEVVKEVKLFVKPQVIEEPKVVVEPKPIKTFDEAVAEAQSHIERFDSQNKVVEPPKVAHFSVPKTANVLTPITPTIPVVPIAPIAPVPVAPVSPVTRITPIPVAPVFIKPQPLENMRTYEGDVADTIKTKNTSVLTMAIAENERSGGNVAISNTKESHSGKNIIMAIASIVLIAGGTYGGYYLYSISPLAVVPIVKESRLPSIITADAQKIITTPSINRADFVQFMLDQFKSTNVEPNKVTEYVINQTLASTSVRFTGKDFVNVMDFEMTDTLKRSLTERWMVGLSSVEEQGVQYNFPFIILTTDFFQNAFSGMLKWENSMPEDLSGILNFEDTRGGFKDKVIMNRDIREYIGMRGEVLFLYTFIDKDTILITTSEAVVPIILDRIEKQTYVR